MERRSGDSGRRAGLSEEGFARTEAKYSGVVAGRFGDLELRYGSWPLANIRMANALKQKSYDFHFSFGKGSHNTAHGAAEFPAEMTWLWRDYDPEQDGAGV